MLQSEAKDSASRWAHAGLAVVIAMMAIMLALPRSVFSHEPGIRSELFTLRECVPIIAIAGSSLAWILVCLWKRWVLEFVGWVLLVGLALMVRFYPEIFHSL